MNQPPRDEPDTPSTDDLREHVERTRSDLGETVEALAEKTDVKARAQEKAGELRAKTAELAHQAQDQLPDQVKDKAAQAAAQARAKAAQAGELWEDKAPEPVRRTTAEGARLARDHRKVLVAAAGGALVVWLAYRRRKG
ncbi:DUF3618 domain-containing protein [Streptomyces sp. NPDC090106]|uniref:DUF3618 domain-containing protein n=1 Tax=Streptomyces sp. NPDC090106 TaxID=3365946 RepID=UPI00381971CB